MVSAAATLAAATIHTMIVVLVAVTAIAGLLVGFNAGFALMRRLVRQAAIDEHESPVQRSFSGGCTYQYCWTEWTWTGPRFICEIRSCGTGSQGGYQ